MTERTTIPAGPVRAMRRSMSAMLARIDAGELDASPTLRARIEGAIVTLDVLLGADPKTLPERLAAPEAFDL